jgi:hypothetical protein
MMVARRTADTLPLSVAELVTSGDLGALAEGKTRGGTNTWHSIRSYMSTGPARRSEPRN